MIPTTGMLSCLKHTTLQIPQDLRELAKNIVPLARVRYYIAAPGGPTPREAVILKMILVIHEGIDWVIDRPLLRCDDVSPLRFRLLEWLFCCDAHGRHSPSPNTLASPPNTRKLTAVFFSCCCYLSRTTSVHTCFRRQHIATLIAVPIPPPLHIRLHRHYRDEVIPTALELYASLPQDILGGVDLEVGHMLPEAMFVITGIARPSWRHWEPLASPAAPQRHAINFSNGHAANDYTGHGYGGYGYASGVSIRGRRGGRSGVAVEEDNRSSARGEGRLDGTSCSAGGLEGWLGFEPGPWIIFRLTQAEYLEFYAAQAVALDEAIGGMGNMLC